MSSKLVLHKFTFHNIQVDTSLNTITKNKRKKRIEPKLIELLTYFALHPNRVISRKELMENVWADVIISDEVVNRAIFSLRNVLGDNAKESKFIETVPKKGYQFLPTIQQELSTRRIKKTIMKALFSLIAVLLIIVFINYSAIKNDRMYEIDRITPFTSSSAIEHEISASPNGEKIAYISQNSNENQLLTKSISTNKVDIIVNDSWLKTSPKWLDNSTIIFIRCNEQKCQIVQHNPTKEIKIIYSSDEQLSRLDIVNGVIPSLLFAESSENKLPKLISLNLLNGTNTLLKDKLPNISNMLHFPLYIEERNMLFAVSINSLDPVLHAFDFTSGEESITFSDFEKIYTISRSLDSNSLLITGTISGTQGIWLFDIDTLKTTLVLRKPGAESIQEAIAVKQTNSIYYSIATNKMNIVKLSNDRKVDKLAQLNSNSKDFNAVYAPNSDNIYFVSNRTGYREVWFYDQESEKVKQITNLNAALMLLPVISNDNKFIAVTYRKNGLNLAILDSQTGKIISNKVITDYLIPLSWSFDNESVYLTEYSAKHRLFKLDKKSLTTKIIKNKAGLIAQEMDNGQSLVTFDYKTNTFIKININNNTAHTISDEFPDIKTLSLGQLLIEQNTVIAGYTKKNQLQVIQHPLINDGSTNNTKLEYNSNLTNVYSIHPQNKSILAMSEQKQQSKIMSLKLK